MILTGVCYWGKLGTCLSVGRPDSDAEKRGRLVVPTPRRTRGAFEMTPKVDDG